MYFNFSKTDIHSEHIGVMSLFRDQFHSGIGLFIASNLVNQVQMRYEVLYSSSHRKQKMLFGTS